MTHDKASLIVAKYQDYPPKDQFAYALQVQWHSNISHCASAASLVTRMPLRYAKKFNSAQSGMAGQPQPRAAISRLKALVGHCGQHFSSSLNQMRTQHLSICRAGPPALLTPSVDLAHHTFELFAINYWSRAC
jgi:hypothetical protein